MADRFPADRRRALADAGLALVLLGGFTTIAANATFQRPEWYDWVAYALPAANAINRGTLALPQLGPQFGFDRFWLFNSPWMGAGPLPAFALSHVGRIPYLIPIVLGGAFNAVVFAVMIREALGLRSRALSVYCGFAFLGHRVFMSEFFNQRYSVWSFGLLALAFRPARDARGAIPWWRWACAGVLPLIHPALAPASAVWLSATLLMRWRRGGGVAGTRRADLAGPLLFAVAVAAAFAWYGRVAPLRAQFLPHIRYLVQGKADVPPGGYLLEAKIGRPYSLVEQAESLAIASASALVVAAAVLVRTRRSEVERWVPALMLTSLVALDVIRDLRHLMLFLFGLGPCLPYAVPAGRWRKMALVGLAGFATAQLLISLRVDRTPPTWVDQRDAVAFVLAHSRPGDRIVLGPPFILASSKTDWPEGREVVRVTPQPFYLDDFDTARFRSDVRRRATVYLGEREWYEFVATVFHRPEDRAPLFPDAAIEEYRFASTPVIVARTRGIHHKDTETQRRGNH